MAAMETTTGPRIPSARRTVDRIIFPFSSFFTSPAFAVALTLG